MRFGTGTYMYMSTRNNNFSNRSQKGAIIVQEGGDGGWSWALIIGVTIFIVCCVVGAVVAWGVYGEKHPDSMPGGAWVSTRDWVTGFVNH